MKWDKIIWFFGIILLLLTLLTSMTNAKIPIEKSNLTIKKLGLKVSVVENTPHCSNKCWTVYNISWEGKTPFYLDTTKIGVLWKTKKDGIIRTKQPKNVVLTRKDLLRKKTSLIKRVKPTFESVFSTELTSKDWVLINISGSKGDFDRVDNILSLNTPNGIITFPEFAWWNSSYQARYKIYINNTGSGVTLTNYQVRVDLNSTNINWSYVQNCSDFAFTYYNSTSGSESEIPFWIEYCNKTSEEARIWVNITKITPDANTIIYLYTNYYDNTSIPDKSNGDETFLFFDDFNDGVIDNNKWDVLTDCASVGEYNGYLNINITSSTSDCGGGVVGKNTVGSLGNYIIEWKGKRTGGFDGGEVGMSVGFTDKTSIASYYGYYDYKACSEVTDNSGVSERLRIMYDNKRATGDLSSLEDWAGKWVRTTYYYYHNNKTGKARFVYGSTDTTIQLTDTSATHQLNNLYVMLHYGEWKTTSHQVFYDFVAVRKYLSSEPYAINYTLQLSNNFIITAINEYNNSQVLNFSAWYNNTRYDTNNGTIIIPTITRGEIINITIGGDEWLNHTYPNYNTINNLQATLHQAELNLTVKNKLTSQTIPNLTIITPEKNFTGNNSVILRINAEPMNITILTSDTSTNPYGYEQKTLFINLTPQSNTSQTIFLNPYYNITLIDENTNNPFNSWQNNPTLQIYCSGSLNKTIYYKNTTTNYTQDADSYSYTGMIGSGWYSEYPPMNYYDNNYSSYARGSSKGLYIIINYNLSNNAIRTLTNWESRLNSGSYYNLTIPNECWQNPIKLNVSSTYWDTSEVYCWDYTTSTYTLLLNVSGNKLYEEAMYWKYNYTTHSKLIPMPCQYDYYKILIDYNGDSYYRIIKPPYNQTTQTIYLSDLSTTTIVEHIIIIQDYTNQYNYGWLIIKRNINGNNQTIIKAQLPSNNQLTTYLAQGETYHVWIEKNDETGLLYLGSLTANVGSTTFTIGSGSTSESFQTLNDYNKSRNIPNSIIWDETNHLLTASVNDVNNYTTDLWLKWYNISVEKTITFTNHTINKTLTHTWNLTNQTGTYGVSIIVTINQQNYTINNKIISLTSEKPLSTKPSMFLNILIIGTMAMIGLTINPPASVLLTLTTIIGLNLIGFLNLNPPTIMGLGIVSFIILILTSKKT